MIPPPWEDCFDDVFVWNSHPEHFSSFERVASLLGWSSESIVGSVSVFIVRNTIPSEDALFSSHSEADAFPLGSCLHGRISHNLIQDTKREILVGQGTVRVLVKVSSTQFTVSGLIVRCTPSGVA